MKISMATTNSLRGRVVACAFITLSLQPPLMLAQHLEYVGVIGNSGETDWSVVRSSVGRCGGGVVVDGRGRLFVGGGDRILTLNHNGNLLWQTRLPDPNWVFGGGSFAIGGKFIYFLAGNPVRYEGNYNHLWTPWTLVEPNLCRVEMAPEALPQVLATRDKFKWIGPWWNLEMNLTSVAGSDHVYLGYTTSAVQNGQPARGPFAVLEIQPDGTLTPLFEAELQGGRVSVDEAGSFYLGGGGQVRKVDRTGQPIVGYAPKPYPSLGAVPTGYTGSVMLTRDALWEMGHYGFIGRYTREMQPNPGALTQWQHALGRIAQVSDAPGGGYYLKSADALYLAAVEDDRLKLLRRFGSLPRVHSLAVTSGGYVAVGNDIFPGMLWFDFNATDPASTPVRCEYPGAFAQGFPDGPVSMIALGVNPGYLPREYQPTPRGFSLSRFKAEPFNASSNHSESLATGEFDGDLVGVTRVGGFYFAIDRETNRLLRSPGNEPCRLAPVDDPSLSQGTLTSVAAVADQWLVISAGETVHCFVVAADGALKPAWQFARFGPDRVQAFGKELNITAFANQFLVSDARRHRVVLFAFANTPGEPPTFQDQFGVTDEPGADAFHLNHPTLVSTHTGRSVVYDSENQRVVKLRVR